MTGPKLFLLALLTGFAAVVAHAAIDRMDKPVPSAPAGARSTGTMHRLSDRIAVRDQLTPADVATIAAHGFGAVFDLRPDGEVPDQPSSDVIGNVVRAAGLRFAYLPTPHGDIPEAVVRDLGRALDGDTGKVLLYCRSGKRAARVWALAEASRAGGSDAAAITAAVRAAGQPIDDLLPQITKRIASRSLQP